MLAIDAGATLSAGQHRDRKRDDVTGPHIDGLGGLDFERLLSEARQTEQRIGELQARQAEMRVTGTSPDGMVEVTVDGTGRLTDVTINPRGMRLDSFALAEDVTAASRAAYETYDEQTQRLLGEALGNPEMYAQVTSGTFDPYEYLKGFGLNAPELRGLIK